jgi:hypothetical protein
MPHFYCLDEREVWHEAACAAARKAGYTASRIFNGEEAKEPGVGFIRPHADWRQLPQNRIDYAQMKAAGLTMIQDDAQVELYEDKSGQFDRWAEWMPETWFFMDEGAAQTFLAGAEFPLVSKADVGASSVNVRILYTLEEAQRHIAKLFSDGIWVHHGANCPQTKQKGYALLQRFIPHKTTYRVNAIGDARAIFFRYCYPDKPVAQTGNVDPAFEMTPELESLLEFSDRFFAHAKTKWCALDVLKDGNEWKLLETSLAWPWPSPGECNRGTIFRSGGKKWIEMFDVMFDEVERGAWSAA